MPPDFGCLATSLHRARVSEATVVCWIRHTFLPCERASHEGASPALLQWLLVLVLSSHKPVDMYAHVFHVSVLRPQIPVDSRRKQKPQKPSPLSANGRALCACHSEGFHIGAAAAV